MREYDNMPVAQEIWADPRLVLVNVEPSSTNPPLAQCPDQRSFP